MEQIKHLISSGCSFSECISKHIDTWPRHLARTLPNYKHISGAMGSQGNGLISRSVIYHVSSALKISAPENILVGIVWSGPGRHDFYYPNLKLENKDGWMENPTGFNSSSKKNWVIINPWWETELAKIYYSKFFDNIGALVYTLEHVLRVQWFLEKHKIRYFMSTYTNEVFPKIVQSHVDTSYLYDQINFDNFLPVEGIYEWCRDYSNLEFPVQGDNHPSSEQHELFTTKVILPFLSKKGYI